MWHGGRGGRRRKEGKFPKASPVLALMVQMRWLREDMGEDYRETGARVGGGKGGGE